MIEKALENIRPSSLWILTGNSYEYLEWIDTVQTKPTQQELETEVARLQAEYDAKEYQLNRAKEYPDFRDYLDGVVKGDAAQVQAYIDACNAVKAKYPKGE